MDHAQNILRIGVHKVLATKKLYGQTGIDLLIDGENPSWRVVTTATPWVLTLV